jgi:hypothetical protein
MGKVICIGFQKTGTTTLGKALESLGYNHTSFNQSVWDAYWAGDRVKVLSYMDTFDSADDGPWNKPDMIPLLDHAFSNSRFIYLDRDEEAWKQSVVNWTIKQTGSEPNMKGYLKDYLAHKKFVDDYFVGDKASFLLRIDVSKQGTLNQLKSFLGFQVGEDEFPHHNQTSRLK